nr:uncharacterized protein CTRU02_15402 [Colletotrichum truncatum]KAF6781122.1 hypothetical protein CTRU02_15402 [Colletotrichum truncatum]
MEYLANIQLFMEDVNFGKDNVVLGHLSPENRRKLLRDKRLKDKLIRNALLMKNRFVFAHKATSLYNEVSDLFIMPSVRWATKFQMIDAADDVLKKRVEEIEDWDGRICGEAAALIKKRAEELNKGLEAMNRELLETLKEHAPSQTLRSMGEATKV